MSSILQYFPKNLNEDLVNFSVPVKESGIKNLISGLLDLKIEKRNFNSIALINKILNSNVLKKTFGSKIPEITKQSFLKKPLSIKTKTDKVVYSISLKKWEDSSEVLFELNTILQFLIETGKLNEFESQELALVLLELKEIEHLNSKKLINLLRLKQLINSFIKEISVRHKPNKDSNINFMGLLESRGLDFETVILTSVNEGVMPKGRDYESLLPFDLKAKYNLQTHNEKDRVYSYHFYRLIQRAKNIFLIYNSQEEGLKKAEKSRFIYQLELDKNRNHKIEYYKSESNFESEATKNCLEKTPLALKRIKEISIKGFSPSSLEAYIKNPKEYYFQKLLNLKKEKTNEVSANHKTIGLIFHETIESLYKPFIGKSLEKKDLKEALRKIDKTLKKTFSVNNELFNSGKNLILFEVIKSAIQVLIQNELNDLNNGSKIKIIALEKPIKEALNLENNTKVSITGVIDRIDEKNGVVRIIDYKTGLVSSSNLTIKDMSLICSDPLRTKAMQLMCYVWMYHKSTKCGKISAGIISFRNLSNGTMKLKIKNSQTGLIDSSSILSFEKELKKLISEIMDPKINFKDSET